jgi:ribonuclease HI
MIMENIENCYKGRDIYILFDSQVVIKALKNFEISYKLVWDCYQSLMKLAEYDRIHLIWVPGHRGIDGNEMARRGSSCPLIGPEPALDRLPGVDK